MESREARDCACARVSKRVRPAELAILHVTNDSMGEREKMHSARSGRTRKESLPSDLYRVLYERPASRLTFVLFVLKEKTRGEEEEKKTSNRACA